MKKYLLTVFGFLFIILVSCEKKKSGTTTTNTSSASLHTNVFLAKVNGASWETYNEGFSTSKSTLFNFEGQNAASSPYSSITFNMAYTTTVGVNSFGTPTLSAKFRDTLGIYYTAKAGTINITLIDTFKYGYKRLKGSFSFMTDTVGGKFYSVENGAVDFKL
jgi:hypothetical protein